MRKSRLQQKKEKVIQLDLFKDLLEPAAYLDGGTGKGILSGVELLSQLEKQRTLTGNLLEDVVDYGNLLKAYQRVLKNGGKGGFDQMEVGALGQWLQKNLDILCIEVLEGQYQVGPVRKVTMRKLDGGERQLGIPTVKDRMVQQSIHQTLNRHYVKSKKAGERVMVSMNKFIEQKLKLKVNRKKSGVRHCSETKFLGYTLLPGGNVRISDTSLKRLKDKVREITKRNRGVKFEQVIKDLNAVIIGWTNYFYLANRWLSELRDIDGWIRRKLRCYRLKQCGRKYTIFKFLLNLGISERTSWNIVMYSQGWWAMSVKHAVSKAMGIKWFAHHGLQSIQQRVVRL